MSIVTAAFLGAFIVLLLVIFAFSMKGLFYPTVTGYERQPIVLGWSEYAGKDGKTPSFFVATEANRFNLDTIKYRVLEHPLTVEFNPIDPEHLAAIAMLNRPFGRQHPTLRFKFDSNQHASAYDAAIDAIFHAAIKPAVANRVKELGVQTPGLVSILRLNGDLHTFNSDGSVNVPSHESPREPEVTSYESHP